MKNKIILIVVPIFIIAVLVLGTLYFLKGYGKTEKTEKEFSDIFQSSLVSNWSAVVQGQIISISDRTFTLYSNFNGEQLSLDIEAGAQIGYLVFDQKTGRTAYQEFKFEDIKSGDKVNVVARLEGGSLIGGSVTVLPQE